jgi:hypothetical protein
MSNYDLFHDYGKEKRGFYSYLIDIQYVVFCVYTLIWYVAYNNYV